MHGHLSLARHRFHNPPQQRTGTKSDFWPSCEAKSMARMARSSCSSSQKVRYSAAQATYQNLLWQYRTSLVDSMQLRRTNGGLTLLSSALTAQGTLHVLHTFIPDSPFIFTYTHRRLWRQMPARCTLLQRKLVLLEVTLRLSFCGTSLSVPVYQSIPIVFG